MIQKKILQMILDPHPDPYLMISVTKWYVVLYMSVSYDLWASSIFYPNP